MDRKDILIIGNGFDLAHGLPTKYTHFLKFCDAVRKLCSIDTTPEMWGTFIDEWDINPLIKNKMNLAFDNRETNWNLNCHLNDDDIDDITDVLSRNFWWSYFSRITKESMERGENWIDFEYEIKYVISNIDFSMKNPEDNIVDVINQTDIINSKKELLLDVLNPDRRSNLLHIPGTGRKIVNEKNNVRQFRDNSYNDLELFVAAFNIYIHKFVDIIEVQKNETIKRKIQSANKILSFNYTDTYEKYYSHPDDKICYVHGKMSREKYKSRLVLGINEYWSDNERDNHVFFTKFKKFSQRIINQTDSEYIQWIDRINENYVKYKKNETMGVYNKVIIMGHSLDITDKDVLAPFIESEATNVEIYCYDESEVIANLVNMIGYDKVMNKLKAKKGNLRLIFGR